MNCTVCMLIESTNDPYPNSTIDNCYQCDRKVWCSPNTQCKANSKIICQECFMKINGVVILKLPSEEELRAIRKARIEMN
jgi:hypothetical protein